MAAVAKMRRERRVEWVGEEGVVVGRVGLEAQFSEVGLDIVDGVQRGLGAGEVGVLSEGP